MHHVLKRAFTLLAARLASAAAAAMLAARALTLQRAASYRHNGWLGRLLSLSR
jgi:hypothetical protein